jgi:hypothetical protein
MMMPVDYRAIGKRATDLRNKRSFSQRELAKRAGPPTFLKLADAFIDALLWDYY